jgi:hypothetical protein
MSEAFRKFIFKILIFTVLIFGVASILFVTILENYYFNAFPYLILLIATVTTIGHLWVVKASGANTMKFTTAFMASVTLKLMVYLFFMLIYLLIDRTQVISFVLTFITLYVLFTIFEVIQVLGFIKK